MSQSSGSKTESQTAQTSPWAPTQPYLQGLISSLGGLPTGVTPQQQAGAGTLYSAASNLSNNTVPGIANAQSALTGSGPGSILDFLKSNYSSAQNTLAPQLSANFTNPMSNPATASLIDTITQQTKNAVNGQFAGAGRDLSPANNTATAYGISQGLAQPLFNEYNSLAGLQQGAAGTLANLGVGSAGQYANNALAGGQLAGLIPGLAGSQLSAATQGYGLPFSNIGAGESMILPIAGLGGQSQSQGQTNITSNPSLLASIIGGLSPFGSSGVSPVSGFGSFLKGLPGFGG